MEPRRTKGCLEDVSYSVEFSHGRLYLYFQEESHDDKKDENDDEEKMPDYDDDTKALIAG